MPPETLDVARFDLAGAIADALDAFLDEQAVRLAPLGPDAAALLADTPHFIAFIVGFAVLGVYWIVQHNMFRLIRRIDTAVLWLASLFLIWVSVVPFTTALLGNHPLQRLAILLYALNLILGWISLWTVWRHVTRGGHTAPDLHPSLRTNIGRLLLFPAAAIFRLKC